tara:strand:+ start:95 stop:1786 length:1692 start_codon:yes stop_codon:yes gene_type:complete
LSAYAVVGGRNVPGTMQNLLLQGVVVVTMAFSLLLLRSKGCEQCVETRELLQDKKVPFKEEQCATTCTADKCYSSVMIDGIQMGNIQQGDVNERDLPDYLHRRANAEVVFYSSKKPWKEHLTTYYSPWQYVGAVIILVGLFVSVYPAIFGDLACGETSGAGPPLYDLLFFTATVPTALSAVYKEIAFRKIELDVWYVNFWVSVFQFTAGLLYAPLAAKMSGLPIPEIPQNMKRGFFCFLLGTNYIGNGNYDLGSDLFSDGMSVGMMDMDSMGLDMDSCFGLSTDMCDTACNATDVHYDYCEAIIGHSVDTFSNIFTAPSYAMMDEIDCSAPCFVACDPLLDSATVQNCLYNACGNETFYIFGPKQRDDDVSCYPYCNPNVCSSPDTACLNCGAENACCDACDGGVPCLSSLSALLAVFLYMAFNISYNTLLLLVIKYGSAALMYVASTVVLPLGGVAFTLEIFLGPHALPFTVWNGAGLVTVLAGLICYRFLGSRKRKAVGADIVEGNVAFSVVGQQFESEVEKVEVKRRTDHQIRSTYYQSLGIGVPYNNSNNNNSFIMSQD